jgi:hypothetical protein
MPRRRLALSVVALISALTLTVLSGASQANPRGRFGFRSSPGKIHLSGVADPSLQTATRAEPAQAEAEAPAVRTFDDVQVNGDNKRDDTDQFGSGEGFPQNETTIAVNPTDPTNVVAGANDYEPGVDTISGVYASFDGGRTWPYSTHLPDVQSLDRDILASGDPAVAFDSEGTAYYATINFARSTCDSWIVVSRSTDKGVTWTMPAPAPSHGLKITPGDGVVTHNGGDADCQIFHDKEYIAAGPRPAGVDLVPGTDKKHVSRDRLYVTWTLFDFGPGGTSFVDSPVYVSYTDDQGRHWSAQKEISGSAGFCRAQLGDQDAPACDESFPSVPVVDPRSGTVYVAFENFNTCCAKNQFLLVKSTDGGDTWSHPVRIAPVHDGPGTYPICEGSQTLDDMCARIGVSTGNIDINPRTGDLYVTWYDNRNGTKHNTNTDVFVSRSTDGGGSWSAPANLTRASHTDQWQSWLSVTPDGRVAVSYYDRRWSNHHILWNFSLTMLNAAMTTMDTRRVSDVSWNADFTFRLGFFMGDYTGLDTTAGTALPFWTDGRFGEHNQPGNNPPHQQSDVMIDVEPI